MTIRSFEPLHSAHSRTFLSRRPRKRRTIRGDIASRRDELLALREEGWTIDVLSDHVKDALESAGWPCVSGSYVTKVISEVTKDAFPRRRSTAQTAEPSHTAFQDGDGLIPVFRAVIGGVEMDAVDARELHTFLEVGKMFAHWIQDRIQKYGFIENQDFVIDLPVSANQTGRGGDRRSKDYILTLGMAKELAMVERTPKGRDARRYFIEIERRYYVGEHHAAASSSPAIPARSDALFSGVLDALFSDTDVGAESGSAQIAPSESTGQACHDGPSSPADKPESPQPIAFLDSLFPLPFADFLALAQQIYDARAVALRSEDPAKLQREALEEAARITGADLGKLIRALGGHKHKFWIV